MQVEQSALHYNRQAVNKAKPTAHFDDKLSSDILDKKPSVESEPAKQWRA